METTQLPTKVREDLDAIEFCRGRSSQHHGFRAKSSGCQTPKPQARGTAVKLLLSKWDGRRTWKSTITKSGYFAIATS